MASPRSLLRRLNPTQVHPITRGRFASFRRVRRSARSPKLRRAVMD